MRILLIDDDEPLMEVLASKLVEQHYAVDIATSGEMGWEFIQLFDFDLVILDWMLPDVEGVSLCQQIRAEHYEMPVMLLTARNHHTDKIEGLDSGADDYVVKPFDFEELIARIRALLRRKIFVSSPTLEWAGLILDTKTHQVTYDGQPLSLTPKEYSLLELLLRSPQQVFSPGAIIENLWAGEDPPGEEAVRTHVKGLRQKLKATGMAKDTIQTIYGVGYRLKSSGNGKFPSPLENVAERAKRVTKAIKQAEAKFKSATWERLADLERLAVALTETKITQELLTTARNSAHKLAGSLGGFGYSQGSRLAKEIELAIASNLTEPERVKQYLQLLDSLHAAIEPEKLDMSLNLEQFTNPTTLESDRQIELLAIALSPSLAGQLTVELAKRNIKTIITSDRVRIKEVIEGESLAAILIAIAFPPADLALLAELHDRKPTLPIIVIMEGGGFGDRLNLVRQGASLILPASVSGTEIVSAVVELMGSLNSTAKIVLLDDDPQVLASLEYSLRPCNFQLTTLERPQDLWGVIEEIYPDLLVLDIEMPEISGIELCRTIRSDRRWQHLPVLFLTVHQDAETQRQAFAIGADDYISKPVVGTELASRILNRLARSRSYMK